MKKWFEDRFDEPSSWAAFGGALTFISIITKSDETQMIADAVTQNADTLAQGDYVGAGLNIMAALAFGLGFVKREKAR